MTAQQAMMLFCRTSATMAEVARAYGTDEDTMRDIIAAQCNLRPGDDKSGQAFNVQVKRASEAYAKRGFVKAFKASDAERDEAIRLYCAEGLSMGAIARGFKRDISTIQKWIADSGRVRA
nr:MAG TPA: HOMEOBOX PROTEIN PAX-6/DNA COMPLEX, PAIRED DOMAIN, TRANSCRIPTION, PROTEIN-DNA.5A [Caudoviricetes sp.]